MILGLAGQKNSGKSTVAEYLAKAHDFERISFSSVLNRIIAAAFDITPEQVYDYTRNPIFRVNVVDTEPFHEAVFVRHVTNFRRIAQRLVDGIKQEFGELVLLDKVLPVGFQHHGFRYVCENVRFPMELLRVRELGGYNIHVLRPETDKLEFDHPSEEPPHPGLIDYTLVNDGSIERLQVGIEYILEQIGEREAKIGGF